MSACWTTSVYLNRRKFLLLACCSQEVTLAETERIRGWGASEAARDGVSGQLPNEILDLFIEALHKCAVAGEILELWFSAIRGHIPDSPQDRMQEFQNLDDIFLKGLAE